MCIYMWKETFNPQKDIFYAEYRFPGEPNI